MPIKIVRTEIRPNLDTAFYTNPDPSASYRLVTDPQLIDHSSETSVDGLTCVSTFILPDSWDANVKTDESNTVTYIRTSYNKDNNIHCENTVTQIDDAGNQISVIKTTIF